MHIKVPMHVLPTSMRESARSTRDCELYEEMMVPLAKISNIRRTWTRPGQDALCHAPAVAAHEAAHVAAYEAFHTWLRTPLALLATESVIVMLRVAPSM